MFLTAFYKFFITIAVFLLCQTPIQSFRDYDTDEENILLNSNLFKKIILTKSYRPNPRFVVRAYGADDLKGMETKFRKFIKRDDDYERQSINPNSNYNSDAVVGGGAGINTVLRNNTESDSERISITGRPRRNRVMSDLLYNMLQVGTAK